MDRTEILIDAARRSTRNEKYSSTMGISQDNFATWADQAQTQLIQIITESHPNFFTGVNLTDLVTNQEAYNLPSDALMTTRVLAVEWLWQAATPGRYRPLRPRSLHMRDSYVSSVPVFYIRLNNQLLINPVPGFNQTSGLRITYETRPRRLDVRRGKIVSTAGSPITSITIDTNPALTKDAELPNNAASQLNNCDKICIVDSLGVALMSNIPVDSYSTSTGVITVSAGFTSAAGETSPVGAYVVLGDYATTHSDLPDHSICREFIVAYMCYMALQYHDAIGSDAAAVRLSKVSELVQNAFAEVDGDVSYIDMIDPERML